MASRKEDERNERVIRSLLKLQDNRRCINCNSLGPQYVCTNFWTFVCTNCSGIHREFTHRVKSVSMAKFTTQEVEALRTGGNKCARRIYFKDWDAERHSNPDGSNVERLRDFIKHVYVDKRYTGEKIPEKPPRWKMQGGKDDVDETGKMDAYQSGFRSPSNEDNYERRHSDGSSPGLRSPANERSNIPQGDVRRISEVVNDWRREDRFRNGKKSEDLKSYRESTTQKAPSPVHQRYHTSSSPPMVRPVREILGENITLHVAEPPRVNSVMSFDGSVKAQRSGSSSSLGSADGFQVDLKHDSLIDFDAITEPTTAAVEVDTQPVGAQPSFPSNHNWASFESASEIKVVQQPPSSLNTLESALSVLSVRPQSVPQPVTVSPASDISFRSLNFDTSTASVTASQNATRPGGSSENQWNPSLNSSIHSFDPAQSAQIFQSAGNPVNEINSVIAPTQVQSGRRELPGDLFSSLYPSTHTPFPTWQSAYSQQAPGGASMQYSTIAMQNNLQSVESPNPFNINEPPRVQQSAFPSMPSLPTTASFPQAYSSVAAPQYSSQQYPFVSSLPSHAYFSTPSIPPGTSKVSGVISNLSGGEMMSAARFGGETSLNRNPSFSGRNPFD